MSTPPFINMPDGVGLFAPPESPLPVLVAEAATRGAGETDVADRPAGEGGAAGHGAGGAPTPRGDVLLVPGFTGSKEDFIAILEPLAAFGWRVAAMDLPGRAAPRRSAHVAATPCARSRMPWPRWLSGSPPVGRSTWSGTRWAGS